MTRPATYRLLVMLAILLLSQKGCEIYSRLQPQGTEIRLLDGTRLLVHSFRPVEPSQQGLQTGDTLVYLHGQAVRDMESLNSILQPARASRAVGVQVRRSGRMVYLLMDARSLDFRLHPEQASVAEAVSYLFAYLFAFLTFGAGILVMAMRPNQFAGRLFLMLAASLAFASSEVPHGAPMALMIFSGLLILISRALFPAFFLHFFLTFPQPIELPKRRSWVLLIYVWGLPALALQTDEFLRGWMGALPTFSSFLALPLGYFYAVLCFVLAGLAMGYSVLHGTAGEARKLRWMILATCAGILPGAFVQTALPALLFTEPPGLSIAETLVAPLSLVFPLAFTYPLLRYRVVDIRWALRRGAVALGSAWPLRLLMLVPAAFVVRSMLLENRAATWHFILLMVFVVAMSRVQGFSTEGIDRLLFRALYNKKQDLTLLMNRLSSMTQPEAIRHTLLEGTRDTFNVAGVYLFLWYESSQSFRLRGEIERDSPPTDSSPENEGVSRDSSLLALLMKSNRPVEFCFELPTDLGCLLPSAEKELLLGLGVVLVVPMRAEERWVGLLALGEKVGEEAFSGLEKELLMLLGNASGKSLGSNQRFAVSNQ